MVASAPAKRSPSAPAATTPIPNLKPTH